MLTHLRLPAPAARAVRAYCVRCVSPGDHTLNHGGGSGGESVLDAFFRAQGQQAQTREAQVEEEDAVTPIIQTTHSAVAFPHPGKVRHNKARGEIRALKGHAGEDAYVVAQMPHATLFGVADGVREWDLSGIDSGIMSRAVLEEARRAMIEEGYTDPAAVLQRAWAAVKAQRLQGSTTVCLASIDLEDAVMRVANLGDSGCRVLRPDPYAKSGYSVVFRTAELQHSFGKPFQLGHHNMSSEPSDAELASVTVGLGDIVLVASDGLFDNLDDAAIAKVVGDAKASKESLAMLLGKAAFAVSMDKSADSPFARTATSELDMFYTGGKPDDITVIAVKVEPAPAP